MAVIDRTELLGDLVVYLPEANTLSDPQMLAIIGSVIDYQIEEDDEIFYSEALCKSLKASALMNKSTSSVDDSGLKREKVGGVEYERYNISTADSWDDYIKSLKDVCPYLPKGGYIPSGKIGIKINPSEKFKILDT